MFPGSRTLGWASGSWQEATGSALGGEAGASASAILLPWPAQATQHGHSGQTDGRMDGQAWRAGVWEGGGRQPEWECPEVKRKG